MSFSPMNIASILQSTSLNRHPSPAHDINPSTAASIKQPLSPTTSIASDDHSIPYSTLKPAPRRSNLPPLPDLRFEQSYLASLRAVDGWKGVLWVTVKDQVGWGNSNFGSRILLERLTECRLPRNRFSYRLCRVCCGRLVWRVGGTGTKELRSAGQALGGRLGSGGGESITGIYPKRCDKSIF